MRSGVLGGTFDPPHLGHLILAAEAVHQLKLSQVLFVLTPSPPHKIGWNITPVEDRLKLLEMAIMGNSEFQVSFVDIERLPPHYAVDSMNILHQNFPEQQLIYLMGADSLHDLPTWHRAKDFVEACDGIGVMQRTLDKLELRYMEEQLPGIDKKVIWLSAPRFDISSSEIRRRVKSGAPFRYFVPESVYQYILQNKLYG
ncbi:MAG: nicotinate-nucleotide adenylyltransferase [Anaerolineales bacterium]